MPKRTLDCSSGSGSGLWTWNSTFLLRLVAAPSVACSAGAPAFFDFLPAQPPTPPHSSASLTTTTLSYASSCLVLLACWSPAPLSLHPLSLLVTPRSSSRTYLAVSLFRLPQNAFCGELLQPTSTLETSYSLCSLVHDLIVSHDGFHCRNPFADPQSRLALPQHHGFQG